jgi:hypothetical protein
MSFRRIAHRGADSVLIEPRRDLWGNGPATIAFDTPLRMSSKQGRARARVIYASAAAASASL